MEETNKNTESPKSELSQDSKALPLQDLGEAAMFAPLTAEYLLERGYCCGNGCKNCPYDYKAISEPRRSKLLAERKKNESSDNGS